MGLSVVYDGKIQFLCTTIDLDVFFIKFLHLYFFQWNNRKMESGEGEDMGATFLTSEPYMVEGHSVHQHDDEDKDDVPHLLREQDRFLPIANVARIMKKGIPKTGKVSYKDDWNGKMCCQSL